jgi:hypothetical protein
MGIPIKFQLYLPSGGGDMDKHNISGRGYNSFKVGGFLAFKLSIIAMICLVVFDWHSSPSAQQPEIPKEDIEIGWRLKMLTLAPELVGTIPSAIPDVIDIIHGYIMTKNGYAKDKRGNFIRIEPDKVIVEAAEPMNPGKMFFYLFNPLGLAEEFLKGFIDSAGGIQESRIDCANIKYPYYIRHNEECGNASIAGWKTYHYSGTSNNVPLNI